MFGYVTVNQRKLTPEEFERYRAFYCGLCRTLYQQFGFSGSSTLSNDSTFLLMLLHSLYEPAEEKGEQNCLLHPMKRHPYVVCGNISQYVADMNLALTYYMCLDHWQDDHHLLAGAQMGLIRKGFRDVESRREKKCRHLKECIERLNEIEKASGGDMDADLAAAAMGDMLGDIFVYDEKDVWADELRQVGVGLGKFIYLMDACEDLEKDLKKGRYNPFAPLAQEAEDGVFFKGVLSTTLSSATDAFERLPLVEDLNILRNILYSGCWGRYAMMLKKKQKKQSAQQEDPGKETEHE